MTWVILTGRQNDLDQAATPHKIITNRDYLAHPALFRGQQFSGATTFALSPGVQGDPQVIGGTRVQLSSAVPYQSDFIA